MVIEYAHFVSKPPIDFNKNRKPSQVINHTKALIEGYHIYHERIIKNRQTEIELYNRKKECKQKKICLCGQKMRYVREFDFWGCPDYKNNSKQHISFKNETEFYVGYFRVPLNWVTEIILSCNLKGIVNAKEVFEFFLQSGLKDLRVEYGKSATTNSLYTLEKAKKNSKQQERAAELHLASKFPKVKAQQCIVYALECYPKTFCIPDFICGNEQIVCVADAKLAPMYIDDDKMDLYTALVEYIIREMGDPREVIGAHILYKEDAKYITNPGKHSLIFI